MSKDITVTPEKGQSKTIGNHCMTNHAMKKNRPLHTFFTMQNQAFLSLQKESRVESTNRKNIVHKCQDSIEEKKLFALPNANAVNARQSIWKRINLLKNWFLLLMAARRLSMTKMNKKCNIMLGAFGLNEMLMSVLAPKYYFFR